MTGHEFNAALAFILVALGVTIPMAPFVGGMAVALGCCFAVMTMRPLESRRSIWLTLFMGGMSALLAAVLHPAGHVVWLWGQLPLQAQMGLAGGLSQALWEALIAFGIGLKDRAARLPEDLRWPGQKDGG